MGYRETMFDDERDYVLERRKCRIESMADLEAMERDRRTGVNAEPSDGFRDGVTSAKRMHPDHYIPNCK